MGLEALPRRKSKVKPVVLVVSGTHGCGGQNCKKEIVGQTSLSLPDTCLERSFYDEDLGAVNEYNQKGWHLEFRVVDAALYSDQNKGLEERKKDFVRENLCGSPDSRPRFIVYAMCFSVEGVKNIGNGKFRTGNELVNAVDHYFVKKNICNE